MTTIKGQWHVDLGELHEVRSEDGSRICIITQLRGRHGIGGRIEGQESVARANLIAAAPDLLHACKDIFDFLYRSGYDTTLVKAAIAKAEGRS